VQDTYSAGDGGSRRSNDKQQLAQQVMALAQRFDIPITFVNKGILNTLFNNRPHQGYVLRCPKLDESSMISLSKIPVDTNDPNYKLCWLVLDEIVDP
jgi:tRNA G18 (ribose-2'-O)-methylase SpoU